MNLLAKSLMVNLLDYVISDILSPANIQKYGDRLLDLVEEVITDSSSKIDDTVVMPVVRALRVALHIPDAKD